MAFNTSQGLISTLTTDKTLAFATLVVLYGVFTCTTIVAPKLVDVMGPRLAITLGAVPYVLFVFANILPVWGTLLPASAAVGFGAGLLWTGQGIYLSRCAVREAALKGEPVDIVTSRMNGIFWPLFQFNAAIGLTLASVVLGFAKGNVTTIKLMFAGFGAVGLLGIAILFSLKNAPPMAAGEAGADAADAAEDAAAAASVNDGDDEAGALAKAARPAAKAGVELTDTLRLIYSSGAMRLLLPAIFYNGASIGFFTGTFPLIYQDPPAPKDGSAATLALLPSAMVGYQAATFYLLNSGFSFAFGKWFVPRFGKRPLFLVTLATAAAFFGLLIALQLGWLRVAHESAAAYALVFGLAIAFAMGDSVLESQLPAIIQSPSFFPVERERDAANAVLRMLMSLGFCTQFALGVYLECPAGGGAPGCGLQAAVLLPLMVLALACVAYCDRFVRPVDGGAKPPPEYAAVPGGTED